MLNTLTSTAAGLPVSFTRLMAVFSTVGPMLCLSLPTAAMVRAAQDSPPLNPPQNHPAHSAFETAEPTENKIENKNADSEFWQVRVGDRAAKVASYAATMDLVVLVPDEATFLAAIAMWGFKNGRWPILIEDNHFTPIFIKRFHPQQVLRLPSIGAETLPAGTALQAKMLETVAWIWRNPAEKRTPAEARATGSYADPVEIYNQAGWLPPGIVLTSESDPAWPAAVTLAAAYGQPLAFLNGDFGNVSDTLGPNDWENLNATTEKLVSQTGYTYNTINDEIDVITIVRQLAARYRPAAEPKQILAVTDGLARRKNGRRWGVAGWLYGTSVRSVYQAMSSIFIRARTPLMFDTYPDNDKYKKYRQNTVPAALQSIQMQPAFVNDEGADLEGWQKTFEFGFAGDALFLNSSGLADRFKLVRTEKKGGDDGGDDGEGADEGTVKWGYAQDLPILNNPTWFYMVHSWSAQKPDDVNTIAGRCLDNGAIAYVGAINEPYLQAFVPPGQLAERLRIGSPFLIAARFENALPWKILTIGDPLATFKIKGKAKRLPRDFNPGWPEGTIDLAVLIGRQVPAAGETGNWAPFFDTCRKLARPELALRYYHKNLRPALQKNNNTKLTNENLSAIQLIIPMLFEAGSLEELAFAIRRLPAEARTRPILDMLWSRANPKLSEIEDEATVRTLMSALREPLPHIDASRLAPTIARVLGTAADANHTNHAKPPKP